MNAISPALDQVPHKAYTPPRFPRWILAASLFIPGAIFAQTAPSIQPPKGESKMTAIASTLSPAKDAPEALRRLLALIDSLHEPKDLTVERVRQFTGLKMPPWNTSPGKLSFIEFYNLTEEWKYSYYINTGSEKELPASSFFFDQISPEAKEITMTDICQIDANQFHNALLDLGYKHVRNGRYEILVRQYQRGAVDVEVGYVGESNESLEKINHKCIKRVYIGFVTKRWNEGELQ